MYGPRQIVWGKIGFQLSELDCPRRVNPHGVKSSAESGVVYQSCPRNPDEEDNYETSASSSGG
jgi:hypothetical protein